MTNYYQTLGVQPTSNADEIKKAYRKLAGIHHPDKGGDTAKFQEIQSAYDTLSDQNKRAEYDQLQAGGGQQFRFASGDDFANIFGHGHPFGDMFRRVQRNRDLNIHCQISLLDAYQGKQLEASYRLPSGKQQSVVISVPPGVEHGTAIRYRGLGDDTVETIARGDLNVTIVIMPDPDFRREFDDLYTNVEINPIEAMIGCRKQVKTITNQTMTLDIRGGVNHGTEYASQGQGFPNVNHGNRGRFVSVIHIVTPEVIDPELIEELKKLNAKINNKS